MTDTSRAAGPVPLAGAGPGRLLHLAWPLFIEHSLHVLTGVVDVFMVSHVSDSAVAALAVANQVVIWFIVAFNFIGLGALVVVTHHLGAGDREGADRVAATGIAACLWLGLLASALIALFSQPLLRMMQLPPGLMVHAGPFLAIVGAGLVFEGMSLGIGAALRAHGHTREVMLVAVLMNLLNVIGNSIALFGWFGLPQYGVVGVAVSTVFARACAALALWWLLTRYHRIRFGWRDLFDLPRERLARILHIGAPAAGENLSWWTAFMVITTFTARVGEQALAAQSYWMSVAGFMILSSVAIGQATEIVIGHQVGAGRFDDAYRQLLRSLRVAFAVAIGVSGVIALAAPWIMSAFTSDPVVLALGTLVLRLSVPLEAGRTFNLVVINALRASGDARFPFFLGTASMWGVWVPLAWFLGLHLGWGLLGVWAAGTCDEWCRGLLMYRRWRRRQWVPYAQRTHERVNRLRGEGAGV